MASANMMSTIGRSIQAKPERWIETNRERSMTLPRMKPSISGGRGHWQYVIAQPNEAQHRVEVAPAHLKMHR